VQTEGILLHDMNGVVCVLLHDEYTYDMVCILLHHINDIACLLLDDTYTSDYGVATISRPLKIIGLFCKRAL